MVLFLFFFFFVCFISCNVCCNTLYISLFTFPQERWRKFDSEHVPLLNTEESFVFEFLVPVAIEAAFRRRWASAFVGQINRFFQKVLTLCAKLIPLDVTALLNTAEMLLGGKISSQFQNEYNHFLLTTMQTDTVYKTPPVSYYYTSFYQDHGRAKSRIENGITVRYW